MSDSNAGEIAELEAKAQELQRSLDTVARRIDQLRSARDATRPPIWWKQPVVVGVLSSAVTALVIGGFAGLASGVSPCAGHPPPPPIAVTPPPAVAPCEPAPTPPSPAVPRRPHVETVPPPAAKTGALGSLTIVCLPAKCIDIVDNGVSIGPGHIFNRPTTAGRHSLVLKSANATKIVNVEIVADQLKEVRMVMGESNGTNSSNFL